MGAETVILAVVAILILVICIGICFLIARKQSKESEKEYMESLEELERVDSRPSQRRITPIGEPPGSLAPVEMPDPTPTPPGNITYAPNVVSYAPQPIPYHPPVSYHPPPTAAVCNYYETQYYGPPQPAPIPDPVYIPLPYFPTPAGFNPIMWDQKYWAKEEANKKAWIIKQERLKQEEEEKKKGVSGGGAGGGGDMVIVSGAGGCHSSRGGHRDSLGDDKSALKDTAAIVYVSQGFFFSWLNCCCCCFRTAKEVSPEVIEKGEEGGTTILAGVTHQAGVLAGEGARGINAATPVVQEGGEVVYDVLRPVGEGAVDLGAEGVRRVVEYAGVGLEAAKSGAQAGISAAQPLVQDGLVMMEEIGGEVVGGGGEVLRAGGELAGEGANAVGEAAPDILDLGIEGVEQVGELAAPLVEDAANIGSEAVQGSGKLMEMGCGCPDCGQCASHLSGAAQGFSNCCEIGFTVVSECCTQICQLCSKCDEVLNSIACCMKCCCECLVGFLKAL